MVDRADHLDRQALLLHDRPAEVDQPAGVGELGGALERAVDEQRS
jgi:hypothetical protein